MGSTIEGIVLNYFEKPWDMVMKCSMDEFIESMVKDIKIVKHVQGKHASFLVKYVEKKRKLEKVDDGEKEEPKRKKYKKETKREKIVLPAIKIKGPDGMEIVQKMIEKLKRMQDDHDIHFHF